MHVNLSSVVTNSQGLARYKKASRLFIFQLLISETPNFSPVELLTIVYTFIKKASESSQCNTNMLEKLSRVQCYLDEKLVAFVVSQSALAQNIFPQKLLRLKRYSSTI